MRTIKLLITSIIISTSGMFAQTENTVAAYLKSYEFETIKDYTSAINTIKENYDPKSYELNLRLAWLHYEAGLYIESASFYQLAIDTMLNSIEAKLGLVYPLTALGNMDQVIAQYKNILETDPQNTTANYRLGLIYYDRKEFATASNYFEKVVLLYPMGYDALLMYAWSTYQTGKTGDAKILFNKVLMISPYDISATEGLGLIK